MLDFLPEEYRHKKQPACEVTTEHTQPTRLHRELVKHLSYTTRFSLSLVALLLYALKAQPVTSAGRNQKNVYASHQHHSLAVEARDEASLLKRIGNCCFGYGKGRTT